jgi:hypothetical protein
MEKEPSLSKYRNIAKALSNIALVGFRLSIGLGIVMFIAAQVVAFAPGNLAGSAAVGTFGLSAGGVLRYELDPMALPAASVRGLVATILFLVAVGCGFIAPFLRQVSLILKDVSQDRPFAIENAHRLSLMGWLAIFGSVVVDLVKYVGGYAIMRAVNIPNLHAEFGLSLGLPLIGLLLLILAGVFRYGNLLQQDYDQVV